MEPDYIAPFRGSCEPRLRELVLKKGFRHCALIIRAPHGWRFIDPLRNELCVKKIESVSANNLIALYEQLGHTVQPGMYFGHRVARLRHPNCVAVCTRLIGLHAQFVITPSLLYQRIRSQYLLLARSDKEDQLWSS